MLDLGTLRIGVEADASAAKKELNDIKQTTQDVEEQSQKTTSGMSGGWKSFASTAGTIAVGAFAGITAAVGGLVAVASETQEDMGKLDTAFQQSGFSAEAATDTYRGFVGLLGETDTAVEASNHLAKLCTSEEQLSQWTNIAAGVFATFGDSLPLEGLTEAANETAKTGTVVGSLADALNWAGVSEDDFNAKLAACNSEQERSQLITETLNGLYSEAGQAYQENNANLIAFRQAQSDLNVALSEMGTALMPIVTALINFGATILNAVMPYVQQLGTAIQGTFGNSGDLIQNLVNQFMSFAGAIGTTLQPVIDAIMPSVQAFMSAFMSFGQTIATYVVPYVQALVNLVIQIGSTLGSILMPILQTIIPIILQIRTQIMTFVQSIMASVYPVLTQIINLITQFISWVTPAIQSALSVILNIFNTVWPAIQQTVSGVMTVIQSVISTVMGVIQGVITTVMGIINGDWSAVWSGIQQIASSIWSGIQGIVSGAISAVQGVISTVLGTISGLWNAAWSAISSFLSGVWEGIKSAVSNGINGVVNFFRDLPGNILSALGNMGSLLLGVGQDLINGLVQGIGNAAGMVIDAIGGVVNDAIGWAKGLLGIASPSKVFAEIGDFTMQGMEEGINGGLKGVLSSVKNAATEVTDAFAVDVPDVTANYRAYTDSQLSNAASGAGTSTSTTSLVVNNYSPKTLSEKDSAREFKRTMRQLSLA